MKGEIKIRNLTADEIECRAQTIKENGMSLLLYKNARCDMAILDETFGPQNWQRKHYECKGSLFCEIGVKIDNEWIWKGDCGAESFSDKVKGEASDSFKRAGVNWGIGRELYTAPFIWIKAEDCNIERQPDANSYTGEKYVCRDTFEVQSIETNDKKQIIGLTIYNKKTKKVCYTYGTQYRGYSQPVQQQPAQQRASQPQPQPIKANTVQNAAQNTTAIKRGENTASVNEIKRLARQAGVTENKLCKKYGVTALDLLNGQQIEECTTGLQGMINSAQVAAATQSVQEEDILSSMTVEVN